MLTGLICGAVAAGCARADDQPIVETGCLTSSGGRFVLASLETSATAGQPRTELYQLVGDDDDLRAHVGKVVRIGGVADRPMVAEVRETSPATPIGTSGQGGGYQAKVGSESATRIDTKRLKVVSVTPTGDDCETAG